MTTVVAKKVLDIAAWIASMRILQEQSITSKDETVKKYVEQLKEWETLLESISKVV